MNEIEKELTERIKKVTRKMQKIEITIDALLKFVYVDPNFFIWDYSIKEIKRMTLKDKILFYLFNKEVEEETKEERL